MASVAMPYLPEDLNHFQEFTTFLDSIGLPAEWLPSEGEAAQLNEIAIENIQKPAPSAQEQPKPRRSLRAETRGDSPFRSWLPSVPRGDQSLGTLSDSGMSGIHSMDSSIAMANCVQNHPRAPKLHDSMSPRINVSDLRHHWKTFTTSFQPSHYHLAIL